VAESKIISVVMAAGASTRMRSPLSKLLHPLLGYSIIERAWNQASFISSDICMIVGHQRDELKKSLELYWEKSGHLEGKKCHWVVQDPPLGTGDALRKALIALEKEADEAQVFIMGGDAILLRPTTLKDFFQNHFQTKSVVSFLSAHLQPQNAYGRVIRDAQGNVQKIVEVKNATPEELQITEINAGFYLCSLGLLREAISKMTANAKTGEFYLTDIIEYARSKNLLITAAILLDATESLGINNQEDLFMARRVLQNRINQRWLIEGIRMDDPSTTWIDESVELQAPAHLEMGVQLRGQTKIQSGVRVGSYSIIEDSLLAADSVVEAFSHLKEAQVGSQSQVGPFARLRTGSELGEKVKIGNFVEVKKSKFARGSKANHLSYIGDTQVGEESNIGAGTITCNYDGFEKHNTLIGKNVFIGSNSSLVAPVELGEGVVVGAGSVITASLPAHSLGLTRSEQKVLKEGGKKFREKRGKL